VGSFFFSVSDPSQSLSEPCLNSFVKGSGIFLEFRVSLLGVGCMVALFLGLHVDGFGDGLCFRVLRVAFLLCKGGGGGVWGVERRGGFLGFVGGFGGVGFSPSLADRSKGPL